MFLPRLARSGSQRGFAAISSSLPSSAGTVGPYQIFDRRTKRLQKNRAVTRDGSIRSITVDYLRDEVADRMMERFLVCFRAYPERDHAPQVVWTHLGYQTRIQCHS